jgi:hypothetical protein
MAAARKRRRFIEVHLDPASRLGEVLFGLIMVLSITLTTGLSAADGPDGVRQLLLAALGCNIAWGIIDGIMYVMDRMTERAEKANIIHEVQGAPNADAARHIVRREMEQRFDVAADADHKEVLSRSIVQFLVSSKAPTATPALSHQARIDRFGA